uniref:Ovule protein n=1 Tax=Steinernema glaseri TaxID=37863 RepID=A0A1I7ZRV5_9BILA
MEIEAATRDVPIGCHLRLKLYWRAVMPTRRKKSYRVEYRVDSFFKKFIESSIELTRFSKILSSRVSEYSSRNSSQQQCRAE